MITTITLNPSVDIRFTVDDFYKDGIFRARDSQQTAGGKGLNVTRVLHQLGSPVTAAGFLGGSNGQFIREQLDQAGIRHNFTAIAENTRVCIAVLAGGSQTEVLGQGPQISQEALDRFQETYQQILANSQVVCISGSLPQGVSATFYRDLVKRAKQQAVKVLLDSSGEPLKAALEAGPYLIKPNRAELETLLQEKLASQADVVRGMHILAGRGIDAVMVSLGSEGALALKDNKLYRIAIPAVQAVNPVGSGDAMIAGLAHALYNNLPFLEMLALGAACGISNAMQQQTGHIDPDQVKSLAGQVRIEEVGTDNGKSVGRVFRS